MSDWSALDKLYLVCGSVGSLIFLIRLGLMLAGIDHHGDVDSGGGDFHGDAHGDIHDTDAGFKVLTVQGVTAFIMMFGWVGLAVSRASGSGFLLAMPAGFGAGAAAIYFMGWAMSLMRHMQSSGNLDIRKAVGQEGHVYLTIPDDGSGVVQIEIQNRLREMDAVASDKRQIKTGERVRVVAVEGAVLVVDRVV